MPRPTFAEKIQGLTARLAWHGIGDRTVREGDRDVLSCLDRVISRGFCRFNYARDDGVPDGTAGEEFRFLEVPRAFGAQARTGGRLRPKEQLPQGGPDQGDSPESLPGNSSICRGHSIAFQWPSSIFANNSDDPCRGPWVAVVLARFPSFNSAACWSRTASIRQNCRVSVGSSGSARDPDCSPCLHRRC